MGISILQLSDIHFVKENNSILNKIDKIVDAIKNEISDSNYLFLVFTGDIAYSGQNREYEIAEQFIQSISKKIKLYKNDIKIEYIFAAGNHDCDFSGEQDVRDILIDSIVKNRSKVTEQLITNCTAVQMEFFKFVEKLSSKENIKHEVSNKLFTRYIYSIDGYKIAFNSYNLAWISKKKESQSEIVYPTSLINKEDISNEEYDLTISLLHHPLHWLSHNDMRQFKELINSTSNIVLSGHEHMHSAIKESKINSEDHIEYIEAGVLQDSNDVNNSSFNLININFDNKKQDIYEFSWCVSLYEKNDTYNDVELPFKKKSIFQLKDHYKNKINTMGIKVSHPTKEDMTLEDIFIYQDMTAINTSKKNKNILAEYSSEKLKNIHEVGHTIIYGAENSGKTSLIRVLQLKYKRDGLVPIVLNGKEIKNHDFQTTRIKALIIKAFKAQYEYTGQTISTFEQLDKNQIILLIDDFHSTSLNTEYKSEIITNLLKLDYKNIVLFAHDSLLLEATTESFLAKSLIDFNHYQLLELGHKLREKMIRKWISLGVETEINQKDLIFLTREKAKSINTTIGYNIVPSYPIYILTLLQALEANDSHMLEKSSYGHYYHFLIMQYLNADGAMKINDINTVFRYTSTLAYECLKNSKHTFTYQDLLSFDRAYCLEKKFEPTFNIIDKLLKSSILTEYENEYKFSHNYLYYYFVAQYLSDHVNSHDVKTIIERMCKRLYRTEFANIIIFLMHHSSQIFILELLLNETKTIFQEVAEFTFAPEELLNINRSIKKDRVALENRTLEESRNIELEKEDHKHKLNMSIQSNDRDQADYNEDIIELNTFAKLNLAFKMIEILGEIIKSYSGSLDGYIKFSLIEEVYKVGLRSQTSLIGFIEENHDLILEEIKETIDRKHYVTEDKKSEAAADIIFGLVSAISTNIVKKIAKAVASQDLKQIYTELLESDKNNIAKQLITQAISLDFRTGLNSKEIEKIHKKLLEDNNRVTDSALKKLVVEHIYMFDIEHNKKQAICDKLDISVNNSKSEMVKQLRR